MADRAERKQERIDLEDSEETIISTAAPLWKDYLRLKLQFGNENDRVKDLKKAVEDQQKLWIALDQGKKLAVPMHTKASFVRALDRAIRRDDRGKEALRSGDDVFDEYDKAKRDIVELKVTITEHFKKEGSARDVVLRLINANPRLRPDDLMGGEHQQDAIRIAFASHPDLSRILSDIMAHVDPEDIAYKEALQTLSEVKTTLSEPYTQAIEAIQARENLASETVLGNIKGGIKNIGKEIAKNPGAALALMGGSILALYLAYTKGPEPLKSAMKFIGISGAVVAGVGLTGLGADFAVRAYRDDNKGIFDWIGWHPDSLSEDAAMGRLRSMYADMLPADYEAGSDLIRLGTTNAGVATEIFEKAMRSDGAGAININALLSRSHGSIKSSDARFMHDATTYKALEYVMLKFADYMKVPTTLSDSERVGRGVQELKAFLRNHPDWPIFLVLQEIDNPTPGGVPEHPGVYSSVGIPTSPEVNVSAEDKEKATKIYELLKGNRKEPGKKLSIVPVGSQRGVSEYRVNGYLLQYDYKPDGGGRHIFTDPYGPHKGETWTISESDGNRSDSDALMAAIENNMTARVNRIAGSYMTGRELEYSDGGYYVLKPPLVTADHVGLTGAGQEVKLRFVIHERYPKEVSIFVDGREGQSNFDDNIFRTIDDAVHAVEMESTFKGIVANAARYSIGDLAFTIESVSDTTDTTSVKIKYGRENNKTGTLVFKNNELIRADIVDVLAPGTPGDPDVLDARERFAQTRSAEFRKKIEGFESYGNLRAAYEGYWKGAWWENITIPATRGWRTLLGDYANDYLGRGLLHNREDWWEGTLQFKLDEYEVAYQRRMLEIMMKRDASGNLRSTADVKADLDGLDTSLKLELDSDFEQMRDDIHDDLERTRGKLEHGENLEDVLRDSMRDLDTSGYGPDYASWVEDLEGDILTRPGFDMIGADKWDSGRRARQAIRLTAYRLAWPIPIKNPLDATSDQAYLDKLSDRIEKTLQRMQLDDAGNVDFIIGTDRRIPAVDLYDELVKVCPPYKTQSVPSGLEFPLTPASSTGSAPTSRPMDADKERAGLGDVDKMIVDEYNGTFDAITFSPFYKDTFESIISVKVVKKQESFRDEIADIKRKNGGVITQQQFKDLSEKFRDDVITDTNRYPAGITKERAIEQLLTSMLSNSADWLDPTLYLLDYINNSVFTSVDRRTVLEDFLRDIDDGKSLSGALGADPINYTRYFIKKRFIDGATRGGVDYNAWLAVKGSGNGGPDAPYTDADLRTDSSKWTDKLFGRPHTDAEKIELAVDDFNDWYDDNINVAPFGLDAIKYHDWQAVIDSSKDTYLLAIKTSPAFDDVSKQLEVFKRILMCELSVLVKDIRQYQISVDDVGGEGQFTSAVIDSSMIVAFPPTGKIPAVDLATAEPKIQLYTQVLLPANFKALRQTHGVDSVDKTDIDKLLESESSIYTVTDIAFASASHPLDALNPLAWENRLTSSVKSRFNKLFADNGITDNAKKVELINKFKPFMEAEKTLLRDKGVADGREEGEDYGSAYEFAAQVVFDKITPQLLSPSVTFAATASTTYKDNLLQVWEKKYESMFWPIASF